MAPLPTEAVGVGIVVKWKLGVERLTEAHCFGTFSSMSHRRAKVGLHRVVPSAVHLGTVEHSRRQSNCCNCTAEVGRVRLEDAAVVAGRNLRQAVGPVEAERHYGFGQYQDSRCRAADPLAFGRLKVHLLRGRDEPYIDYGLRGLLRLRAVYREAE